MLCNMRLTDLNTIQNSYAIGEYNVEETKNQQSVR